MDLEENATKDLPDMDKTMQISSKVGLVIVIALMLGFMFDPFSEEAADAFTLKMSDHFQTKTSYQMRHLDNDWWSATLASGNVCTSTVYLSTRWEGSTSPLWKYALVHEWVHVSQGANCANNERATRLETMSILAEAEEWGAFIAAANHFIKNKFWTMEDVTGTLRRQ